MNSPFKFLDSYNKEDKEIFFGCERETEELYQKVFKSKIMLVYGVSGTGKSSLIICGLANIFQDTDWLPLNIREDFGGRVMRCRYRIIGFCKSKLSDIFHFLNQIYQILVQEFRSLLLESWVEVGKFSVAHMVETSEFYRGK